MMGTPRPAAAVSPRPRGHELCRGFNGEPRRAMPLCSRKPDAVRFRAHQAAEPNALAVGNRSRRPSPRRAGCTERIPGCGSAARSPEGARDAVPAGSAGAGRERRLPEGTISALRLMKGAMDSSGGFRSTQAAGTTPERTAAGLPRWIMRRATQRGEFSARASPSRGECLAAGALASLRRQARGARGTCRGGCPPPGGQPGRAPSVRSASLRQPRHQRRRQGPGRAGLAAKSP